MTDPADHALTEAERQFPTPRAEVDRVAVTLMAAWERAEGEPVNASRVATFADMARAVLAARAADAALADDVEPCAEFGQHPRGGHAQVVRSRTPDCLPFCQGGLHEEGCAALDAASAPTEDEE